MPYAPGVQDMSGQILGQSIAQAGRDIGDMIKARKEEQKKIQQGAKGYRQIATWAEKNNPELYRMLNPDGLPLTDISDRDANDRMTAGIETTQLGMKFQQLAAEKQRADVAAMQLELDREKLRQRQTQYTFSPLLGRDATADEVVSANNAYVGLLGRDVPKSTAIAMLGGDAAYFDPNTVRMPNGAYQSRIPSWMNMGAGGSQAAVGGAVPQQPSLSPEQASSLLNSYIQSQRSPLENVGSAAGSVGNALLGYAGRAADRITQENAYTGGFGPLGQVGRITNDLLTNFQRYRATDDKANTSLALSQLKKMTPEQLAAFIEQLSQLKNQAKGVKEQADVNQKEIDNLMPNDKNKKGIDPERVASTNKIKSASLVE